MVIFYQLIESVRVAGQIIATLYQYPSLLSFMRAKFTNYELKHLQIFECFISFSAEKIFKIW